MKELIEAPIVFGFSKYNLHWFGGDTSTLRVTFDYRHNVERTVYFEYPYLGSGSPNVYSILEEILNCASIACDCVGDYNYFVNEHCNGDDSDHEENMKRYDLWQEYRVHFMRFVYDLKKTDKFINDSLDFVRSFNSTLHYLQEQGISL